MKITEKIVEHVADLARLEFDMEEKILFVEQLNSILLYMEKINELDTSKVPPTSHVIPINNVYRDDTVSESFDREEIFAIAPETYRGYFKVPKIIE